ncbi:hypothetical protein BHE74_00059837 [Ensete ventricosum]|nr:hypothetical protein BHE74_00059837 [Ensete ventricosum]
MEEKGRACTGSHEQVAPFVAKTYEMVDDPSSDVLIRWGKTNNSFVVVDPNDLSHFLLPSFFKHRNFSSFIRQLNTYVASAALVFPSPCIASDVVSRQTDTCVFLRLLWVQGFRKVDPDLWEFAHESFLRGQTHLLPLVTRRRRSAVGLHGSSSKDGVEGEEELVLLKELQRLRQEQKALDEEVTVMSRRLQAAERRPHQLMSFLVKVAQDPNLLQSLVQSKRQQSSSMEKKKKKRLSAALPLPQDHGILLPFGEVSAMEPTTFDPLGISSFDDGGLSLQPTKRNPDWTRSPLAAVTDGRSERRATEGLERDEEEERDSLRFQTKGGGGGGRRKRVARDARQAERGAGRKNWKKHGAVDGRVINIIINTSLPRSYLTHTLRRTEPSTSCRSAHAAVAIAAGEKEKDGSYAVGPCERNGRV